MYVLAAHIGTAHGIKGEVVLKPTLRNPEVLEKLGVLFLEDGTPFSIASIRKAPKGFLVKFENVTDRTEAEKLRGTALFIPKENLPPLEEDEVYYTDLKGLNVIGANGRALGTVIDVFYNRAQDILVVQPLSGAAESIFIPYTDDAVAAAEFTEKTLHLTPFGEEFFYL